MITKCVLPYFWVCCLRSSLTYRFGEPLHAHVSLAGEGGVCDGELQRSHVSKISWCQFSLLPSPPFWKIPVILVSLVGSSNRNVSVHSKFIRGVGFLKYCKFVHELLNETGFFGLGFCNHSWQNYASWSRIGSVLRRSTLERLSIFSPFLRRVGVGDFWLRDHCSHWASLEMPPDDRTYQSLLRKANESFLGGGVFITAGKRKRVFVSTCLFNLSLTIILGEVVKS